MNSSDGDMTRSNVGQNLIFGANCASTTFKFPFKTSNATSNVPKESQSNFKHMNVSNNSTLELGKPEG